MLLTADDLQMIRDILARYLPGVEVRAFGSRVKGRAWHGSDLDLVVISQTRIPLRVMTELTDAFAESDLSIRVDVPECTDLPDWLKEEIERNGVVVQTRAPDMAGARNC